MCKHAEKEGGMKRYLMWLVVGGVFVGCASSVGNLQRERRRGFSPTFLQTPLRSPTSIEAPRP
jgi:hypothetical protein